jgi:hypothetical protein
MLGAMAKRTTPDHETDLVMADDGHVRGAELDGLGVDLIVKFGKNRDGRLCIRSVQVRHPDGVTGALLRQLPLARIERENLRRLSQAEVVRQMDRFVKQHNEEDAMARLQTILASRRGPARHRNLPDEFFQALAEVYVRHVTWGPAVRSTPSLFIASMTKTPLPTVKGWVHRARLRGYLPPARRGRAG